MCSVLPEDKQGPVLDDIRKISKERRRHRGTTRIVASAVRRSPDDGLTGVYRSTSELFVDSGGGGGTETMADRFPANTAGGATGSLMATVRAARRKQSMSATVVYNPAFYDAPVAYASANGPPATAVTGAADNPAGQPYLRMTPENGFSLHSRPPKHQGRSEPTTQL